MAFVKLFPPESGALPVADVICRMSEEFAIVDADPNAGRDHVADTILAAQRFSDSFPGKQDRLAELQTAQDAAVFVSFGDDLSNITGCCIMPGAGLFFDDPEVVDGSARSLVERAAAVLGYMLYDG